MELHRFDRWDGPLGTVQAKEAVHYQEAGGESSLTIKAATPISKGDRIVWRDDAGTWREHIADEPSDTREGGGPVCEVYCEDALNETFCDKVDEKRIRSGTAFQALTAVLEQTRWQVGSVTVTGARTKSFYHCSVGESLKAIAETWGGEVYSSFDVSEDGVTARYVNLVPAMGERGGAKRYEHGKDLASVKRTVVAGDVYTAMRGYGKGESVGEDEWSRRMTFADVNGGRDYLEDAAALEKWGRPDGKGGKAHSFGTVIFDDCEDKSELKGLTRQALDDAKEPKVSYEGTVRDLAAMGYDYEGTGIGDDAALIDPTFSPELRLSARVMAIKKDLVGHGDTEITIGNIRSDLGGFSASLESKIEAMRRRSSNWDVAAHTPSAYIQQVMDGLNKEFDAGSSYVYQSPEQGIVIGSVPLDANGRPTRTPASAIQLKGGGFRIADKLKANGEFDWRAFGTGSGFTADEITAGTIKGGKSRWNLSTGDFYLQDGRISVTDANGTAASLDPANGFQVRDKAGKMIAGTEIEGGAARFYADRMGRPDEYWQIADLSSGYGGAELVQNGLASLRIEPFSSGGSRAGVALYSGDTCFLRAYTEGGYKGRRVYEIGDIDTGMLYVQNGGLVFKTRTKWHQLA